MKTLTKKSKEMSAIRIKSHFNETDETHVTDIKIRGNVEAATIDGHVCFWVAGRMVRIGPLTPEQAEGLCEDLGYDAVA